jgi:hypothetical protein
VPSYFFEIVFDESFLGFERQEQFEVPLDQALQAAGLGEVTGGGGGAQGSNIDVEVGDPERGLALIREILISVGAPNSTRIIQHEPENRVHPLHRGSL